MVLRIAFQMDPLQNLNVDTDSTFRIAEEALKRGHSLFYYKPDDLIFHENRIKAIGFNFTVSRNRKSHFSLGPETRVDLGSEFDVVWLRQDPPFNMSYITTTHLLDFLNGETLVFNNPFWVRNFPEKFLVLNYPELTPPTMIARNIEMIKLFQKKHGEIIVKPLYGNGGAGIFKISKSDSNLPSLVELFKSISGEPLIVQKFVPEVLEGDKRIILINGEPVGAINRIPPKGEIRSNMHVGGKAQKTKLTSRDLEICSVIGPLLREKNQILVGIDVIGPYLTEINLTSPTGIQELEFYDKKNIAEKIWVCIEKNLQFGLSSRDL